MVVVGLVVGLVVVVVVVGVVVVGVVCVGRWDGKMRSVRWCGPADVSGASRPCDPLT